MSLVNGKWIHKICQLHIFGTQNNSLPTRLLQGQSLVMEKHTHACTHASTHICTYTKQISAYETVLVVDCYNQGKSPVTKKHTHETIPCLPSGESRGVLGVPWNPHFLAIIYIVYVVKHALFLFSRYLASRSPFTNKTPQKCPHICYYGNYSMCANVHWNPPFQNPGSAIATTLL